MEERKWEATIILRNLDWHLHLCAAPSGPAYWPTPTLAVAGYNSVDGDGIHIGAMWFLDE